LNLLGFGTIDLWFTTSVGASADVILAIGACVPAYVLDMFLFGCSTDSASLSLLSSSSLLLVSLAFDSVSCAFCSSDSFWYSGCSSLI